MNELRRPERDIARVCVCGPVAADTYRARVTYLIITDVQLMAAGKGYNMLLYIILYSRWGPCYFFLTPRIYLYLILPNGVFDCCETSRVEHPLRPRGADEKKLHQNRIHTTFSTRFRLWFVTAAAAAVRILYIIIIYNMI